MNFIEFILENKMAIFICSCFVSLIFGWFGCFTMSRQSGYEDGWKAGYGKAYQKGYGDGLTLSEKEKAPETEA